MSARSRRFGRAFARCAWTLAGALLLLLVAKSFVADVYRVHGDSMEPTLHGPEGAGEPGERVLVLYGGAEALERFDLAVIRRAEGQPPVVKRVAGLPGERVQVARGDLFVNGRRLPACAPRPAPVLVFDDRVAPIEERFFADWGEGGPWSRDGDVVRLDARALAPGSGRGLIVLHDEISDGWLRSTGELTRGEQQVNDAVLACEARTESTGGRLRLRLVEDADAFEAVIELEAGGRARASLLRRGGTAEGKAELASAEIDWTASCWHALRFSNVDNRLELAIGGAIALAQVYEANAPSHGASPDRGSRRGEGDPPAGIGARAALGGEGLSADFRAVRVWRDQYWVPRGDWGVSEPLALGPSEYFVLGDNSAMSSDSRLWGAVRAGDVVGRPVCVVWPPSAWRWLRAREKRGPGG
jgi:signal peptidase I